MTDASQGGAILPHMLPTALDGLPGVRVLSLDCFDTLLWRDTHAPIDVFVRLPGTTPIQRVRAESRARAAAVRARDCSDIGIGEIYAQLLPNACPATRAAAIAAEIAAEAAHCFAFAPTVALMRTAKARGLQVIVVSDTYFDAAQLRSLIARAAGEDVSALIDKVFCSSTYGKPKALGLYGEVLRKLAARPHEILHIGDNHGADVGGVAPFGVRTLHLKQFTAAAERRLRHEAGIAALFHPASAEPGGQLPHRAALAALEPQLTDSAEAFGATVLGPVLHGFEQWLAAEASALQAAHGGKVHWLFLMRDGHLPRLVHAASSDDAGGEPGHAAEISRFTATASSFRRDGDPLRYAELELGGRPEPIARQLLLPEADIRRLIDGRSSWDAAQALLSEMRRAPRRKATLAASRGFARRLVAHVRGLADPAPGDTLMLVDLGYNGSVQNAIDGLLRRELGVHVAGRYLLLRENDRPGFDKRGFLGIEHYDALTLEAMCANVALLEQVCTTATGSVIDYAEDGAPIRKANDIKGAQSATRQRIQAGALRFVAAQRGVVIRADGENDGALWRRGAAAVLGRVMYLPFAEELAVVREFQHDVNLGTTQTVPLFDPAAATRGLRQRGLFHVNGAERMYLPAELSGHGLAPKLSLLAHRRFGLPFAFADFADATITLPVIYVDGDELTQHQVEARATHDGYYLAAVPIGDCRYAVAVQFGAEYEYVQVDSVNAAPVHEFVSGHVRENDPQIPLAPALEAMAQVAPGLYRCADAGGFMMIHPPARVDDSPMMVAVVFRPIAGWSAPAAADIAQPLGVAA